MVNFIKEDAGLGADPASQEKPLLAYGTTGPLIVTVILLPETAEMDGNECELKRSFP